MCQQNFTEYKCVLFLHMLHHFCAQSVKKGCRFCLDLAIPLLETFIKINVGIKFNNRKAISQKLFLKATVLFCRCNGFS